MKKIISAFIFLCSLSLAHALIVDTGADYPGDPHSGWIEYSDLDYNTTNRLTIGSDWVNFSMTNYAIRDKEAPIGIQATDWWNGTHLLTDRAGNTFLARFRFGKESKAVTTRCEAYFNISGNVGQLILRDINFAKGQNVEDIGSFTNLEYTLDTWEENGAYIQIRCPVGSAEFWDIQMTIERIHIGRGDYS